MICSSLKAGSCVSAIIKKVFLEGGDAVMIRALQIIASVYLLTGVVYLAYTRIREDGYVLDSGSPKI